MDYSGPQWVRTVLPACGWWITRHVTFSSKAQNLIWQLEKQPLSCHFSFFLNFIRPRRWSSRANFCQQCRFIYSPIWSFPSPHYYSSPTHTHTHTQSFAPLSAAEWQCRHAEENWDVATLTGSLYWLVPFHHPSLWSCRPQKERCTHTYTLPLQQEEPYPGPGPGKLITSPEWSSEAHKAKVAERERLRLRALFLSAWGKMDRQTAQWCMLPSHFFLPLPTSAVYCGFRHF